MDIGSSKQERKCIMVYKIQLKLKDKYGVVKVAYEASNLGNFDYSCSMPTSTFGLPEDYKESAIITKAEGNTGKVVFGWVMKDEATTPFTTMTSWAPQLINDSTVTGLWPEGAITSVPHTLAATTSQYFSRRIRNLNVEGSWSYGYDLKTADAQMIALSEIFEKRGFTSEERHQFILKNETDNYEIFNEEGLVLRMNYQKSGADPVTWNASIEFQIGDVVDSTAQTWEQ